MKRALKALTGVVVAFGGFVACVYELLFKLSSLADAQDAEARQFDERGFEVDE